MNKNKIVYTVVVVIIIIIIIIWAFASNKNNAVSEQKDDVLTVGAILPLSGPTAQFGEIFKNGLEYGLAGNPKVKVIYEDSKGEALGATDAFQKLAADENVDILISNLSKASVPIVPLAKTQKIPLIVSLVAGSNATASDNDYSHRLFWTATQTANLFLARVKESGVKSVAILQAKNEGSQSNADVILPGLEAAGIKVTYETFLDTDTDYRTQLTKIKAAKPDVLAVIAIPAGEWKGILTQAKALGISMPTYDVLGVFLNPGTPEAVGSLGEGVYTFTTPFGAMQYKQDAEKEFETKQGRAPGGFESFGIDTGSLLNDLVDAKMTNRASATQYLLSLKSFEGVTSPYSIDDSHNITPSIILARFTAGKIVLSDK